jgi:hypothetical protein
VVLATLGLGAIELLLRAHSPNYLVEARGLHIFSSAYGWAGRPGASAPMGGGRATLNSHGYRGRLLSLPKPGDRTRVVVLGDSIAFGYGVADDEAFPQLLDSRDNGLEAANLGMEGYGPGQELLVLEREGLAQQPDVVVLAVCLRNDFVDAVLPVALYDGITPRPRYRLVGDRLVLDEGAMPRPGPARALRWAGDHSHLWNRLAALVPRPEGPEDPGWRVRKQEALRDEDYALRLTVALVMEMRERCRARGVAFLVATFPNGLGYAMKSDLATQFHASLRAAAVDVVEVGQHFRTEGLSPHELAIDRTGHLGPRGHALATELLEREIQSLAARSRRATYSRWPWTMGSPRASL